MFEQQYVALVTNILNTGEDRQTRNGATRALFATQLSFDLQVEFPMLQARRMYPTGVLGELAAMLRGPKHIEDFERWGCNYWKKWAKPDGSIALDYGNAWLDFNGVNQIEQLRKCLMVDPTNRRMIISGWRPGADLDLPCCHLLYQFYVRDNTYLDMIWFQRSADTMVGVPSDAIFAAAWIIAICEEFTWLKPGRCTMVFGDTHIYHEHIEPAYSYLKYYAVSILKPVTYKTRPPMFVSNFCEFEPSWIQLFDVNVDAPKINFLLKD